MLYRHIGCIIEVSLSNSILPFLVFLFYTHLHGVLTFLFIQLLPFIYITCLYHCILLFCTPHPNFSLYFNFLSFVTLLFMYINITHPVEHSSLISFQSVQILCTLMLYKSVLHSERSSLSTEVLTP